MARLNSAFRLHLVFLFALGLLVWMPAAVPADAPGVFRFLTVTLPDGSTNTEYISTLIVANAGGPVTFSSDPATPAPGLSLDAKTGLISGIPTEVSGSGFPVTFYAHDGATQISLPTVIKITSTGGGGNSGINFATDVLAPGRVGQIYADTVTVQDEIGPIVFTALDLPPGLGLSGETGAITGTPQAPGTFYITLSATDHGDNENKIVTILPIEVAPAASDFRFTTSMLDNGEVGSGYTDTWMVENATGIVLFAATGLPPGLTVDQATGIVSGTPTASGLYFVTLCATDDIATITARRPMLVVPTATSCFHWEFSGIPAAIIDVEYGRQPPLQVVATNGTNVTYSALGLPAGVTYNSLTGELAGLPTDVGIYPVTFRAVDGITAEEIGLTTEFVVLPPGGGDAGRLSSNLWIKKLSLSPHAAADGKWKATYLYNADRRTGYAFDPTVDTFRMSVGSRAVTLDPGQLTAKKGKFIFETEDEVIPKVKVVIDPRKQTISLSTKKDTITDGVPSTLRQTAILGGKGFRLDAFLDGYGKCKATAGYRTAAFIVQKGTLTMEGGGEDKVSFKLLLADPGFAFESGVSTARIRLTCGGVVVLDRTFTDLVTSDESVHETTGLTRYKVKKTETDEALQDVISKFSYASKNGKTKLAIKSADLTGLTVGEAHVHVELTLGDRSYFTSVTFFEVEPGVYTTKMP
jgi:Putative Ig domain